jgi:hypothetical protein
MVDELKEQGIEVMISPYFHSIQSSSKNFPAAGDAFYPTESLMHRTPYCVLCVAAFPGLQLTSS